MCNVATCLHHVFPNLEEYVKNWPSSRGRQILYEQEAVSFVTFPEHSLDFDINYIGFVLIWESHSNSLMHY